MGRMMTSFPIRRFAWLLAASLLAVAALGQGAGVASGASGSIWTTKAGCATPDVPQDENQYGTGETVTIRGEGFDPDTQYSWSITGQKGGASTDPGIEVASGTVMSDGDGFFCVDAYLIPPGDDGTYSVDAGGKNDNYTVEEVTPSPTPSPTPTPTPTPTPDGSGSPDPSDGAGSGTDQPTTPPTDVAGRAGDDPGSLGLVLMALAAGLGLLMVLTPERARRSSPPTGGDRRNA